jgi:nitrite reductase (NADH) large subunit
MRYAVIGIGVAGVSAIEAIRSVDKAGDISMIAEDPNGYYSRPGLAYYLTGELDGSTLYPRTKEEFVSLNFRYVKGRVTRILRDEHALEVDQKTKIPYDRLLIAVGSMAVPLEVPGAKLEGVFKLDHMEDAKRIVKSAQHGKTAVVVGGGITAIEIVEGLVTHGMKVHYLMRGDRYWSNVLDEHESRIVEDRLQAEGVKLHFHAGLTEILGKNNQVNEVRLKDGSKIKCNLVAYAIGIRPRLTLAQEAGLTIERGILVNEHLQTNDPEIYAAGDVAQAYDPLSGRSILDSLWTPAREQGYVAGLNMAGKQTAYLKSAPFNVTRLAGLTTTIIGAVGHGQDDDLVGIARGDSETWRIMPDAIVAQSGFDINRLRLMVGKNRLIGAIVMGDQTLSLPLQKIIDGNLNISSIHDQLLAPDAKIADVIADYWTNLKNRH